LAVEGEGDGRHGACLFRAVEGRRRAYPLSEGAATLNAVDEFIIFTLF
jgi:hypothetical protein